MNDIQADGTRQGRGGVLGDPGQIAPHVDKAWRDDFIVELRLLGVPGDLIGDALMTVDTHVADSGEEARAAFGDPVPYAREVARSTGAGRSWSVTRWTVVGHLAGLLGMLASVRALDAWLAGEDVRVTVGHAVVLLLLVLLAAALLRWPAQVVRVVVEHRVAVPLLTPLLLTAAFAGAILLLRGGWFEVDVLPVAVGAVVLLAVSVVAAWVDTPPGGDLIVAPGQEARPGPGARIGSALILPLLTLPVLGLTWLLHLLA